jgi:C4-dicarboxylate-specific signal transduction histidine kinase
MSCEGHVIGEAGLQFFGKMSASISHEIKNTLAIINESAGLLEDLTVMAEKGMPMDPARFKNESEKIMRQVQRADVIVKRLNRFAHSVDMTAKGIDLHEIAEFVTNLASRFAALRGVTLDPRPPSRPVIVHMNPFFLEHILYLCLESAMDGAGKGKTVTLCFDEQETRARVRFTRIEGPGGTTTTSFPGERVRALIELLKAEIVFQEETGELILSLPTGP